jgi:large subunit ribosomal protein L6
MSRIGRRPVAIPSGVSVTRQGAALEVKGPKGTLRASLHPAIEMKIDGASASFGRGADDTATRALHGLARATLQNMVRGVTSGFVRELEIHGTGYRADVKGRTLNLALGLSHPVAVAIPEGISVTVQENRIRIEGADRTAVGQFASDIRELRPPEPYKGKGIRYTDEHVRRKVGKAAAG